MEFEDGTVYEFMSPIGVLTFVCDSQADIPIRVYGPDGLQLDPTLVTRMANCPGNGFHAGFMAWDLSHLAYR